MEKLEQKIIVMVGVQGSGKSFEAQKLVEEGYADEIISSDSIRRELFGDENSQADNEKVFKEFYRRMTNLLEAGKSVVLDATNINIKMRRGVFMHLLNKTREKLKIIAYVVNTPLTEVYAQNSNRDRVVPLEVINKYVSMYQHPQKYEGFDEIILKNFTSKVDWHKVAEIRHEMDLFNQENSHHIYTLGGHCQKLAENYYVDGDTPSGELVAPYNAGWWHDVGKLFTKSYGEDGQAHYYSHAQVGTYYLVSHPELFGLTFDQFQEAMFYVNFHMNAHDWRRVGGSQKYQRLFGKELYDKLMEFSGYDRLACGTTDIID